MSPEVLEGATEFSVCAFRQIDVYAAALVLWEVRCRSFVKSQMTSRTRFEGDSSLPCYRLPYEEELGSHPTLGEMRELIVGRKRRPQLRATVRADPTGKELANTMAEMWEQEAEGRISAGCARERVEELRRVHCEQQEARRAVGVSHTAPQQRRTSSPPSGECSTEKKRLQGDSSTGIRPP